MATATITRKAQITLPKEVCEALRFRTGDRVDFVAEEKGVYKLVAATRDVRSLKGLVSKPAKPVGVEEMNRAIARGASKQR